MGCRGRGGGGGVLGLVAVSVLREVFTRCNSNMLGTSGCTGDSVFNGDSLALWGLLVPKSTFDTCDVFLENSKESWLFFISN